MSPFAARLLLALLASAAIPALAFAPRAHAQDSAVRSAADAFGERVGIEQLGLYSEGQVRGFDLQASGAYRIDDAYFARAAPLNDPVLAGVGVRVGVNASRLAYPAPSGVVTYRLRAPAAADFITLGAGIRDYRTPTLEANGSWQGGEADRYGVAGGVVWRPESNWGAGTTGRALDLGLVGRWRIGDRQTLRAFATAYLREYDGDYGIKAADGVMPPAVRPLHNYSPEWARVAAVNANLGLLYDGEVAGFSVDLSAFRSIYDNEQSDFTLISAAADGSAKAVHLLNPPRTNVSDSAEARIGRVIETGGFSHLVSASLRGRRSTVDLASTVATPLPAFNLAGHPAPVPRPVWSGSYGEDRVDQVTASIGYGLLWDDRLQLRLGAHRTRYEKAVRSITGAESAGTNETMLYNASVVWSVTPRASVFASWVTGLEETGTAPQTAVNRNEVLAPVEAEQFELGVRYALTDRLTLIGAAFEVSKPTMGFRPDGTFGLVGEVAHRGFEASLAGRLNEKTGIVVGAVAFEPEVSGPLVDLGLVGNRPAGLSEVVANASIERQIGAGWSVDGQVSYFGERWVDTANSFTAPAVTTVNLGARRAFEIGGRDAQLRLLASNVTNEQGYWAGASTLLFPIAPRTFRAMLTVTFGG